MSRTRGHTLEIQIADAYFAREKASFILVFCIIVIIPRHMANSDANEYAIRNIQRGKPSIKTAPQWRKAIIARSPQNVKRRRFTRDHVGNLVALTSVSSWVY